MFGALVKLIEDLENDASLFEPDKLRERIDALDRLDLFHLEVMEFDRARAIQARLEDANFAVYEAIRCDVKSGRGADALLRWLPGGAHVEREGYDYLDELLAGILEFDEPAATHAEPIPEMVFYQPTPARHIFDLLHRTALTEQDVLIDLGSGLGHVPLLTGICTGARAIGIEFEPAYVMSAQRIAEKLNLERVSFIHQDARAADLSEGTVFYLYTPFRGVMLRAVLDSLRSHAAKREIRVCTFGPCATAVADEDWLEAVGSARMGRVSVFRSSGLQF